MTLNKIGENFYEKYQKDLDFLTYKHSERRLIISN